MFSDSSLWISLAEAANGSVLNTDSCYDTLSHTSRILFKANEHLARALTETSVN